MRQASQAAQAAHQFWSYTPRPGIHINAFLAEYDKRYATLDSFQPIRSAEEHARLLFVHNVSLLLPDLAHRIQDLSFKEAIQTCKAWGATNSSLQKSSRTGRNVKTCNYYRKPGHLEADCRTKAKNQPAQRLKNNQPT